MAPSFYNTTQGRINANRVDAETLAQDLTLVTKNALGVSLRASINQAAAEVTGASAKYLGAFQEAFKASQKSRRARIKSLNQQAAQLAQADVITSYIATRSGLQPYREDDQGVYKRYSGGKMLRALESPNFFKATESTIQFGVTSHLNKHAKQWRRLNSGDAFRGDHREVQPAVVDFFGTSVTADFSSTALEKQKLPIFIPPGFWSDKPFSSSSQASKRAARRSQARYFYPSGAGARGGVPSQFRISQGIAGARFLEDGINTLNKSWTTGMYVLVQEWLREVDTTAKGGPFANIGISPGSPELRNFRSYMTRRINQFDGQRQLILRSLR